ncbi:MAG TPA: hypothetical protein VIM51_07530 [Desulfosporosinus sp.]
MRDDKKKLPTMVIMLITMLSTGAAVGMVFPFFAKLFVVVMIKYKSWENYPIVSSMAPC